MFALQNVKMEMKILSKIFSRDENCDTRFNAFETFLMIMLYDSTLNWRHANNGSGHRKSLNLE